MVPSLATAGTGFVGGAVGWKSPLWQSEQAPDVCAAWANDEEA